MLLFPLLLDVAEPDFEEFPSSQPAAFVSAEDAEYSENAARLASEARVQEEKDALDGQGPNTEYDGHKTPQ